MAASVGKSLLRNNDSPIGRQPFSTQSSSCYINSPCAPTAIQTPWKKAASRTHSDLYDIWGSSTSDIWAVGTNDAIYHWDGTSWGRRASGNPDRHLRGVWGTNTDVWAVGIIYGFGGGTVLHWNGSAWSEVWNGAHSLSDVWGSSASDVWVIGSDTANEGVILHWDGKTWSESKSGTGELYGVWGSSATDVWAVGEWHNCGVILRWNGSAWSKQDNTPPQHPPLHGVWGSSSTDVWAVGFRGGCGFGFECSSPPPNKLLHWDGRVWSERDSKAAYLIGGWASDPSNVWAVGANGTILHYSP